VTGTLQQVDNADDAVFVCELVEFGAEIPVQIRVDGVANEQTHHQQRLHAPLRRGEYVQRCNDNNAY